MNDIYAMTSDELHAAAGQAKAFCDELEKLMDRHYHILNNEEFSGNRDRIGDIRRNIRVDANKVSRMALREAEYESQS